MDAARTRTLSIPLTPPQRRLIAGAASLVSVIARTAARRYASLGSDELEAAGREGLVEAAQRFEPARGTPWDKFAAYRIRCAMLDFARVEIGYRRRVGADWIIANPVDETAPDEGRADESERAVVGELDLLATGMADVMFGRYLGEREAQGEDAFVERDIRARRQAAIDDALESLPSRDRLVIQTHYFEGRELKELVDVIGRDYSTVRRIHKRALRLLRRRLRSLGLGL